MSNQDDGGHAFPIPVGEREFWDRESDGSPNGMTLRDYFAAAALQGILSNPAFDSITPDEYASDCYGIADAILAARKEKP